MGVETYFGFFKGVQCGRVIGILADAFVAGQAKPMHATRTSQRPARRLREKTVDRRGIMDNRQTARSRKRFFVRFGAEELKHMGYTEDISPAGMFIKSASVYRPGTLLRVQLTIKDAGTVLLECQVRWAKRVPPQLLRKVKAGMGVKITRVIEGEEIFNACLVGE